MQLSEIECKLAQRTLNEVMQVELKVDGEIGPATNRVVGQYQTKMGLECTNTIDEPTWGVMCGYIDQRFITPAVIAQAAKDNDIPPENLLALWEIESVGEGFLASGLCLILFERHVFYKYVKARLGAAQAEQWRQQYPDICHPVWDPKVYVGGKGEWDRLQRATTLDGTCAFLATSWGLFQAMGFNYALCGYSDVQSFVAAVQENERNQLDAALKFILSQPRLYSALQQSDYATVARIYNGSGYAQHNYDGRLSNAAAKWSNAQY